MKLQFIHPCAELKPYITKIWLFQSNSLLLSSANSLIAPNAKAKIIIPYKNTLTTTGSGKTTLCHESDICFIGIRDVPVTIGTPPGETGSIGIELTTAGAYKFAPVPMHELTNTLFSFADIYGKPGRELLQKMMNEESLQQKVKHIQDFLLHCLITGNRNNQIVDYSVNLISAYNGLIEIKELQRKTGYSKRYLDLLFKEHLGISPKTLATITRFQKFYKSFTLPHSSGFEKESIYELYYDQAHFIKEFKRYTGYTPMKYASMQNDFGRIFNRLSSLFYNNLNRFFFTLPTHY